MIIAIFLLTPRFWEPGPESWKSWVGARVLKDTREFPFYSLGPLYVVYLQLFLFFGYPISFFLEYIVTHLFAYTATYLMLQKFLSRRSALLLTIAWIPILGIVQPGGAVAGIGFLSLYFMRGKNLLEKDDYLPLTLIAAASSHVAYIPFLAGHFIGVIIKRKRQGRLLINFQSKLKMWRVTLWLIKITIIILFVLSISFPSTRLDSNHLMIDMTYTPIKNRSPLSVAFFQIGNYNYVKRNVHESQLIYQDWYFTHKEAYGNADTIFQALIIKPKTVIKNALMTMILGIQLPAFFFTGIFPGPLGIIFWILPFLGFVGLFQRFKKEDNMPLIFSIGFGTLAVFGSLVLTAFTPRYVAVLLPVALLLLCHAGLGFYHMARYSVYSASKSLIVIFGMLSISIGIIANKWTIAALLSPNQNLRFAVQLQIWVFDVILVALGILMIILRNNIVTFLQRKISFVSRQDAALKSLKNFSRNLTKFLVVASIVLLLVNAHYPLGTIKQIEAVIENKAFLSGGHPVSMVDSHKELLRSINKDSKILALEHLWIEGFTNVNLDNIHEIWSMPPFHDDTGKTEKMLSELDVIWVSSAWEAEKASIGTQSHLRYKLHVMPFLEKETAKGTWSLKTVDSYGKIYQKINS